MGWDKSSWAVKHHRIELWLTKAEQCLQQHASHMDTQARNFITAPKPKSSFAVVPTTTRQPSTTLGCPASARPTLGDTDTWSRVATRTKSTEAHPEPSPIFKQRRVLHSCHHACRHTGTRQHHTEVRAVGVWSGRELTNRAEPCAGMEAAYAAPEGLRARFPLLAQFPFDREQQFLQHFL